MHPTNISPSSRGHKKNKIVAGGIDIFSLALAFFYSAVIKSSCWWMQNSRFKQGSYYAPDVELS
jgi:hypothetical protein